MSSALVRLVILFALEFLSEIGLCVPMRYIESKRDDNLLQIAAVPETFVTPTDTGLSPYYESIIKR